MGNMKIFQLIHVLIFIQQMHLIEIEQQVILLGSMDNRYILGIHSACMAYLEKLNHGLEH